LVTLRAVKDVRASRLTAGREQTAEQTELVLEQGLSLRKAFSNAAHQLLGARQDRILRLLNALLPPPVETGLPLDNQTITRVTRPVIELRCFSNTIERDAAPTVERELQELTEWPRRWFSRIAELVEIESGFEVCPAEQTDEAQI
jgi:hypothetical protein